MDVRKIKFNLDISKIGNQHCVKGIRQGDSNSIQFLIKLTDCCKSFPIHKDSQVLLYAVKSDGKKLCNFCALDDDGNIIYTLHTQDTSAVGLVNYQLVVSRPIDGGYKTIASPSFTSVVEPRIFSPEYKVLTKQPEDWDENYNSYYTLNDNVYVKLNEAEAPTFETGNFYYCDGVIESTNEYGALLESLHKAEEYSNTAEQFKAVLNALDNGELHKKLLEETRSMNIFIYEDGSSEMDAVKPSKTGLIRVYLSAFETTVDLAIYEPYWYTAPNGAPVQAIYVNNSIDKVAVVDDGETVERCSYVHFSEISHQLYCDLMRMAENSSVGTERINDGAITGNKIAESTIETANISNSAITTEKIANGTVTTNKLQPESITNERLAKGCISKTKLNSELQTNLNSLLDLLKSNCTIALDGSGKVIAYSDETTISMNLIDNPNVRTVIFGESVTAFSGTFGSISFIENIYVFTEDLFYKLRGVVGSNQTLTYVESYNYIDPLLKNVGGYTLTDIDKNDIAQLVINEFDTAMVEVLGVDEIYVSVVFNTP